MDPATIRVPQSRETPVTRFERPGFVYRYTYARSDDSRRAGDPGQDYLVIREDHVRWAFALCDGVSQSFMGDVAAAIVAEALIDWLWTDCPNADDSEEVSRLCSGMLTKLTMPATAAVAGIEIPSDLPEMLRDVLERKRRLGSESTFVAGRLDIDNERAVLLWMGDSRLRIWDEHGETTKDLGDSFHTQERWSTHRGPVGTVHARVIQTRRIRRLLAYSDGLGWADGRLTVSLAHDGLDGMIAEAGTLPTSDDISYLEFIRIRASDSANQRLATSLRQDDSDWPDTTPISSQQVLSPKVQTAVDAELDTRLSETERDAQRGHACSIDGVLESKPENLTNRQSSGSCVAPVQPALLISPSWALGSGTSSTKGAPSANGHGGTRPLRSSSVGRDSKEEHQHHLLILLGIILGFLIVLSMVKVFG